MVFTGNKTQSTLVAGPLLTPGWDSGDIAETQILTTEVEPPFLLTQSCRLREPPITDFRKQIEFCTNQEKGVSLSQLGFKISKTSFFMVLSTFMGRILLLMAHTEIRQAMFIYFFFFFAE